MARGRVSLSGGFSPRFFMEFCSRGGGVCLAQRCPDRLRRRQGFGPRHGRAGGPAAAERFGVGPEGGGDGPARQEVLGASVPYPAEPGLRKGLRQMSRPQAEHGGRSRLHPWNGRRRGRRGAYGKERSLTCQRCRKGGGATRAAERASRATKNSARRA